MRKYLSVFNNYVAVSLEYRSNIVGLIISELIGMGMVLTLWIAVYRTEQEIGGYSLSQTVLYYVLVPFVGFVTSVKIAEVLGREIKDGLLSAYLLKPYRLWVVSFIRSSAEKLYTLSLLSPVYLVLLVVVLGVFREGLVTWHLFVLGMAIALVAYVLHFFLDFGIAGLAFWTDDVWAFRHFKFIILGILGGLSFPFEFVPDHWRVVLELFPFQYFYYVPLSYMMGNRELTMLGHDLAALTMWLLILVVLSSIVWRKGIQKYGAYGG